jgi:hypothetical protein
MMARFDPATRPYQRRNSRPVITVTCILLAMVLLTWTIVLTNASSGPSGLQCPPSTVSGVDTGSPQAADALDQVAPAAPSAVRIRVLNGGGQRGQANLVASQLGELGFTEAADPTNDPLYPRGNLACRGQLRYGPRGLASARTMRLVLPCVALVQDSRGDDSVDVAVGTLFGEVNPTKTVRTTLQELRADNGGSVDPNLLTRASDVAC